MLLLRSGEGKLCLYPYFILHPFCRCFFDVCDGIFLNYCWNEAKLERSADKAGNLKTKVYVGVDVFGRGCHGGGGFNIKSALQVIKK